MLLTKLSEVDLAVPLETVFEVLNFIPSPRNEKHYKDKYVKL